MGWPALPAGRAGFVIANGARSAHSCTMTVFKDVRKHAAEQGIGEEEVLACSMEAELKESVEHGAMVCAKV